MKEQAANERKAQRTKPPIRNKKERYNQLQAAVEPTVTALMTSVNKINGLSNENKMMKERKRTWIVCTNVTKLRKRRNTIAILDKPFYPIVSQNSVRTFSTLPKVNFTLHKVNLIRNQTDNHQNLRKNCNMQQKI